MNLNNLIPSMASRNLSLTSLHRNPYTCFSCSLNPSRRHSPNSGFLPDTRPSYNTLVYQVLNLIPSMASRNLSLTSLHKNPYTCFSCSLNPSRRHSPNSRFLPDTRPTYDTLVDQAVKLLGPPATFYPSKLQVVFKGEETDQYTRILPRTYNLSHCDFTADLTLTISNVIDHD
ncbi:hypothetical protein LXL04_029938 [Taraxacum kok-saghyz]